VRRRSTELRKAMKMKRSYSNILLMLSFSLRLTLVAAAASLIQNYHSVSHFDARAITTIVNSTNETFLRSYELLINDSHLLTQKYQDQIGKWQSKQYDNKTMVSLTDNYLPRFQKLLNIAESLQSINGKYLRARDLYLRSLQAEIESYKHFRNFLVTGNRAEDEMSTQFLSDALKYEISSFVAFNNATNTDMLDNRGAPTYFGT
jgi:hypothetical protein